jgi:very-short-patch-repair endonuclease
MRSRPTFGEELLWIYLQTKPLGYKFSRQHVYVYILDFYCHALQLVIEVDGLIHKVEEVQKGDREKQVEACVTVKKKTLRPKSPL